MIIRRLKRLLLSCLSMERCDQSKGCPSSSPDEEGVHTRGSGSAASARAGVVIADVNPNKTYKEIGGLESEPAIKGD